MPRKDARKDYRHFPDAYEQLLMKFDGLLHAVEDKQSIRIELDAMLRKTAQSARRDLYRYFGFLRASYGTDPYAASLSDIAGKVVLLLEETGDPDYLRIVLRPNPIVVAMYNQ